MADENYRYLREHRPDLLRAAVEVGLCVTCAPQHTDRQAMGAAAEDRAVALLVQVLREREDPPA